MKNACLPLCLLWFAGLAIAQEEREPVVERPLPPAEAAATMTLPEGFRAVLFAAEPEVQQPINFCIDDRGRLWVAEAYNYPKHGLSPGDRIVILEDTNGDGQHDKRTVFFDGLNYVTGIEVGYGGAWVMSPPYFYFIPDRNGDDVPDGKPEVVLDGFGNHANPHNLANGFAWGPDGWLYGTHGRTNWSKIGKPGTADKDRVVFDGGVYRFHPTKHIWEEYADGTTNPWGIDWNDVGDAFVCNCVTPHLYHVIQGAHYEPWRNRESSRYAYQRIPAIGDHLHFVGKGNAREGLFSPEEDEAGGGHAHCGSLVYLGDSWPAKYRDTFFTHNIHGKRINNDLPRRVGSGYIASHGADLMRSRDPWFVGVTLQLGPDGSVFSCDWSDTGECHHYTNTQRQTGRIFKIVYGQPKPFDLELARLGETELADLHTSRNEWLVRHARRNLLERAAQGSDLTAAVKRLKAIFASDDIPRKLRAFWTLHALEQCDEAFLLDQTRHASENLRAWGVTFLCESRAPSEATLGRLHDLAKSDPSPYVRLKIASALQRLPLDSRWPIATALAAHGEDRDDANLPLMVWYAIEPLVERDLARFVSLATTAKMPLLVRHGARRVASHRRSKDGVPLLVEALTKLDPETQTALLEGTLTGLEGQRTVTMPSQWPDVYRALETSNSEPVRESALRLALVFDDPIALKRQRELARDNTAAEAARRRAVDALVQKRVPDLAATLLALVDDPATQSVAIRGLSEYDHPETASRLISAYGSLLPASRADAVQTLCSRSKSATALLDAVESGKIPRGDLSAYAARQIHDLKDESLRKRLAALWGEIRPTPEAKARQIRNLKTMLTPESLAAANRSAGRRLFQKACANCHKLFGEGGTIGPDITGSQRTNLDYLLKTIVDPSAEVAKDYQLEIIETTAGRVLTGIVVDQSEQALTVQSINERIVVPLGEIESREVSPLSMMPEGQLQTLTNDQIRQLLGYLMGPEQAPLE